MGSPVDRPARGPRPPPVQRPSFDQEQSGVPAQVGSVRFGDAEPVGRPDPLLRERQGLVAVTGEAQHVDQEEVAVADGPRVAAGDGDVEPAPKLSDPVLAHPRPGHPGQQPTLGLPG